ncbi:MAG: hypothetical protein QF707_02975 [Candidatus Poseidoniaceae archaeon]|jgi:hypothetical protein|nr:hypothetical protein [Candidatus Poseidoniaceae archaeon]
MGAVDDAVESSEGSSSAEEEEVSMPSPHQLEIAENILNRLNPKDRHDLGQMIHHRSLICGSIAAGLGIFWWLSIQRIGDDPMNQSESLVKGVTFMTLSYMVPVVVFFASILNAASREKGQPGPALIAGAMFLIMGFFSFEPLVMGLLDTDTDVINPFWQTSRLVILGVGFFFVAKLFIEAFLLNWVMRLEEAYSEIEILALTSDVEPDSNPEVEPIEEADA